MVTIVLMIFAAMGGGLYVHYGAPGLKDPFHHEQMPDALKIEKVRELAELVVLDVPISDVHVSKIEGTTGSIKMIVAVHGDVMITTDLEHANFDLIDSENRSAVLVLPRPTAQRPRVDHDKTRIVEIQRTGLWKLLLGDAGEASLTNRAMQSAQTVLIDAANKPELIERACGHTEMVMRNFFDAMGWTVVIQWDDQPKKALPQPSKPATTTTATSG